MSGVVVPTSEAATVRRSGNRANGFTVHGIFFSVIRQAILRFPEDMENALKTTVLILKSSDF
jgi:hypothetical protein